LGGLSRKAAIIQASSKKHNLPSLIVDSGNLLFNSLAVPSGLSQRTITAEGILDIYRMIGIDGVAVGPYDLSGSIDFLLASRQNGFPWLSANLLDSRSAPIFSPSAIHTVGKLRIGLIGLTGKGAKLPPDVQLVDYTQVLQWEIDKLHPKCDLIILLSSLTSAENSKIAGSYPSVHIIISAQNNMGNVPARLLNSSVTSQTMSKGKYQGLMKITLGDSATWKKKTVPLAVLENRLGSYDWQISRMKKRKELHTEEYLKKLKLLEKKRSRLAVRIERSKNQATTDNNTDQIPSTFQGEFFALNENIGEDLRVQQSVDAIKQKIKEVNKHRRMELSKRTSGKVQSNSSETSRLVGFGTCRECHEKQTDFWNTTEHAGAYETLVKKEDHFNLDCIGCHVTLTGDPSKFSEAEKFQLLNLPTTLQLVGCESCHGPGKTHADDPENVKLQAVTEKSCLVCHTEEHSDDFTFTKKVELIRCPPGD